MSCPLEPYGNRVVVKRERLKSNLLIIPDEASRRNARAKGVVMAVGPACEWNIDVGDVVLFGMYAGAWANADGSSVAAEDAEYYILAEDDLIAKVKNV